MAVPVAVAVVVTGAALVAAGSVVEAFTAAASVVAVFEVEAFTAVLPVVAFAVLAFVVLVFVAAAFVEASAGIGSAVEVSTMGFSSLAILGTPSFTIPILTTDTIPMAIILTVTDTVLTELRAHPSVAGKTMVK